MPFITKEKFLSRPFSVWVNGPEKSGKTRLAMGFPKVFAVTFDPSGLDLLLEPDNAPLLDNLVYQCPMNGRSLREVFQFDEEGFQLLAGDGTGRYTSVARTLKKAARLCSQHGLTIIGICHSPKMKIDESFQHPREMLLGSVSWGAYSDTVITLNLDEMTGIIHVHVMPRNAASEKHELRFGQNGILEAVIYRGKKDVICTKIGALVEGRPITRTEIVQWGEHLHIGSRTCDSAIKICLENGVLEAIGAGIYERTTLSPPELPTDSDYTIEE